jgi:hypothetical protein
MSASTPSQAVFSIGYDFHAGDGTPGSGTDNGNVWGIYNYHDRIGDRTVTADLKKLSCDAEELRSRLLAIGSPTNVNVQAVTDYLTNDARIDWEDGNPQKLNPIRVQTQHSNRNQDQKQGSSPSFVRSFHTQKSSPKLSHHRAAITNAVPSVGDH